MPTSLLLTLPASDAALRAEVERGLAPHAEVEPQPPGTFGANEVRLLVEALVTSTTVVANATSIIMFLLMIKDRYAQAQRPSGIVVGRPGERGVPLEQADEALLRRLLGLGSG
jgi:hypothetical protein